MLIKKKPIKLHIKILIEVMLHRNMKYEKD